MLDRVQRAKPADTIFHNSASGWQPKLIGNMQNVNTKLTQFTILVPALRARSIELLEKPYNKSSAEEVTEFIHECRTFDAMLSSWPSTIPDDWQYFTTTRKDDEPLTYDYEHSELFPGDVDIYYDGWVACVWNSWRCSRMFVNAIIIRCVRYLASPATDLCEDPNYIIAKERLQTMVDGVCSSVPFYFGYKLPQSQKNEPSFLGTPEGLKCWEPKALAVYFLLWPLFVARSAVTVPAKQRAWLRGRMMAILMRFGTVHAKMLVDIGDNDEKRPLFADHWDASMFENIFESSNLYASGGV